MARHVRRVVSTAVALLLLVVLAVPAGATVVIKERFVDPFEDSFDACGFPVVVEGSATINLRVREGKGADDDAYFAKTNIRFADTFTNPETGATATITGTFVINEVKGTRVDGSIIEFDQIVAGQPFTVVDGDGTVVLRDRGLLEFSIVFDTLGDDEPGGWVLDESITRVAGPHPGVDVDICEILTPLIGG